ncbi:MAG: CMGC/CDK protein kinase [Amphiamblys sp. WSBS2006]|nr:MAG: CMGC/CDK protein kinase [Amphiamblys sp. WSBS2006]
MTKECLKHLLLFLSASAIAGTAVESTVDTDNTPEYYDEADYESLGCIGSGCFGNVFKIQERETGKIYALKTQNGLFSFIAESEIDALEQLDHGNIVKMITSSDITSRHEYEPVQIVLEHMPCDLHYAIQNHPETKEDTRKILCQILKGVAHIHSKSLAHGDINLKNILVDPKKQTVKICDFGLCREGGKEDIFYGKSIDGYYSDILSVAGLMARLYLGKSSSDVFYRSMFKRDGVVSFVESQGNGVLDSSFKTLYKEMEGVVSKNGLDLFLQLISAKKTGACTAAEALEHPFFTEGREEDPLPKTQSDVQELSAREPKRRRLCSR